jgi:hypothetical protein
VHLLADKGCDPPFVVTERRATVAFVWIANAPRGMGHKLQEFLNPNGQSVGVYARDLARYLEGEANKARERKDKRAAARWIERIANASGGGE